MNTFDQACDADSNTIIMMMTIIIITIMTIIIITMITLSRS
jgi:hypothetical protein